MLTTAYAIGTTTAIFPSKGIHATCIDCKQEVISKCGPINADHFAHRPGVVCNTRFHDNKTEWHINWQHTIDPAMPGVNVEVPIEKDGSIKRADLISKSNYVIEFQHSHLPKDERIEREKHYKNIIWVVHTDRENSKTWLYPTCGVKIFFNGDDDRVRWGPTKHKNGSRPFRITKEKFIKLVINNPRYQDKIFQTIEQRQKRKRESPKYYNVCYTGYDSDDSRLNPNFDVIYMHDLHPICCAFFFLNWEIFKYELSERRNKEIQEKEAIEQRKIRDPELLQQLLKISDNIKIEENIIEHNRWVNDINQELENHNKFCCFIVIKHKTLKSELAEINRKRVSRYNLKNKRETSKGFEIYCFWLYFNEKIFPVIQRDWATTICLIDKTPVPIIPISTRRSIVAKRKEINRGRR